MCEYVWVCACGLLLRIIVCTCGWHIVYVYVKVQTQCAAFVPLHTHTLYKNFMKPKGRSLNSMAFEI